MDHSEATQQMTAERYLLDELTPEERDAFEQHVFDCPECALDLRAGSVFITEAKSQLPELASQSSTPAPTKPARPAPKKNRWSFWWQPAFALPAFAVMLTVIAFQNFSTIPSLRRAAGEPRVLESTAIHLGTRGSVHTSVPADRTEGLALSIELPQSSAYASYVFELYDPEGKEVWTRKVTSANPDAGDDSIVSLVIPGPGLLQGSYTLSISGITPENNHVEIDRRVLDVRFND
jgi:hypothetical protein